MNERTYVEDSEIKDVMVEASFMLAATGSVKHLFTSCTDGGAVHADDDADGVSCCACRINRLGALIHSSEEALRGH